MLRNIAFNKMHKVRVPKSHLLPTIQTMVKKRLYFAVLLLLGLIRIWTSGRAEFWLALWTSNMHAQLCNLLYDLNKKLRNRNTLLYGLMYIVEELLDTNLEFSA